MRFKQYQGSVGIKSRLNYACTSVTNSLRYGGNDRDLYIAHKMQMIMKNTLTQCDRDRKNNPRMWGDMVNSASDFTHGAIKISTKPNAQYGLSDFNRGMMFAAASRTSVGGYAQGLNCGQKSGSADRSITMPSDTWFSNALCGGNRHDTLIQFENTIRAQVATLKRLKILSKWLTIAIDLHLISRYDRNRGEELITSRYKNGTKYFEGYITV